MLDIPELIAVGVLDRADRSQELFRRQLGQFKDAGQRRIAFQKVKLIQGRKFHIAGQYHPQSEFEHRDRGRYPPLDGQGFLE